MKKRGCVQAVLYQVQAQHSAYGNIAREYISHDAYMWSMASGKTYQDVTQRLQTLKCNGLISFAYTEPLLNQAVTDPCIGVDRCGFACKRTVFS